MGSAALVSPLIYVSDFVCVGVCVGIIVCVCVRAIYDAVVRFGRVEHKALRLRRKLQGDLFSLNKLPTFPRHRRSENSARHCSCRRRRRRRQRLPAVNIFITTRLRHWRRTRARVQWRRRRPKHGRLFHVCDMYVCYCRHIRHTHTYANTHETHDCVRTAKQFRCLVRRRARTTTGFVRTRARFGSKPKKIHPVAPAAAAAASRFAVVLPKKIV